MDQIDLSIADVEADLRAAEAYLTTAGNVTATGTTTGKLHRQYGSPFQSSPFKQPTTMARPAISEDRRKEILAKLSSDRQAAVHGARRTHNASIPSAATAPASATRANGTTIRAASPVVEEPPPHGQYVDEYDDEEEKDDWNHSHYAQTPASANASGHENEEDDGDDDDYELDDDDGEVYYASDIIGRPLHADPQPRKAIDLYEDDYDSQDDETDQQWENDQDGHGNRHDTTAEEEEMSATIPTNYRAQASSATRIDTTGDHHERHRDTSEATSIFSKVFSRRDGSWHQDADIHITSLLTNQATASAAKGPSNTITEQQEHPPLVEDPDTRRQPPEDAHPTLDHEQPYDSFEPTLAQSTSRKTETRIDRLAAPRNSVFADREKQRLMQEMETLKECTFRPIVHKQEQLVGGLDHNQQERRNTLVKAKSVRFHMPRHHSTGAAFPWLTLSPRNQRTTRSSSLMTRQRNEQALVDRLHLDVSLKYEKRERQKQILEAQKMQQECPFYPRINPVSRRLVSRSEYKPIHERLPELQREKSESIQRIRQQLASEHEEFSFTPVINPRSREIADIVLTEKQLVKLRSSPSFHQQIDVENDDQLRALLRPPKVTDRLMEDAEKFAEKRIAAQEYYDALGETCFAPTISETSTKIIASKPEFKLDFLSRQEYFQMVEQEKLEALEDVVELEQEMTFRPNIGNADKVLREMRPDLMKESTQQRLHRLIYQEPRKAELKKQRLREETYGKYSFTPEINSISKALADRSRTDDKSPHKEDKRHELQRYFAGKRFRSRVAKELEQAKTAECTFQPHLIARPHPAKAKVKSSSTSKLQVNQRLHRHQQQEQAMRSVWRSENILHNIETQRQQRAEGLEAMRNAMELKELEHCTFQPNVHRLSIRNDHSQRPAKAAQQKPVIVRGLDRFLELKERAKRQQDELKQREEKVFNPNHAYAPRSYTIPKPFKLSEASKDSIRRRLKAKEELKAKERVECTFAPQTGEAQRRQVLRRLLKDD